MFALDPPDVHTRRSIRQLEGRLGDSVCATHIVVIPTTCGMEKPGRSARQRAAIGDSEGVVPGVFGSRGWPLLLGFLAACTKANPVYQITATGEDAGMEESPPPVTMQDTGVPPRADGPAPLPQDGPAPAEDTALPLDAAAPAPDLSPLMPDVALAPDLAPLPPDVAPDLAPDLAADSGVSTTALIAHWKLDEVGSSTVNDATPNGNNGSTRNGAALVAGGFPGARFPNAGSLRLDGQDDFVEITNKNIPGGAQPKTLAAWFKATNPDTIPIRNLIALTNESADSGIQLGLDMGRVAAWFFGDLGPRVVAGSKVDTGWHHAVYSFDGTTHRLYYDGNWVDDLVTPSPAAATTRTRLGTWKAPEEMFQGLIDDVRVYARALSPAEVMVLFNGY